jgi:hypothetical protein
LGTVLINLFIFSRDFVVELRNKVFLFSFQTKLNSTSSPFPTKQLAEATRTLLDSLGSLAQEVSRVFPTPVHGASTITVFVSEFG